MSPTAVRKTTKKTHNTTAKAKHTKKKTSLAMHNRYEFTNKV